MRCPDCLDDSDGPICSCGRENAFELISEKDLEILREAAKKPLSRAVQRLKQRREEDHADLELCQELDYYGRWGYLDKETRERLRSKGMC